MKQKGFPMLLVAITTILKFRAHEYNTAMAYLGWKE